MFQFASFSDFITMAGHGPYVWVCYLVTLMVMIWLVWSPLLRARATLRTLAAEERRRLAANPDAVR